MVEGVGEVEVGACRDPGLPGFHRDPVRGGSGCVCGGGTGTFGLTEDFEPHGGDLGFDLGEVGQCLALFLGAHGPGGDLGELVEPCRASCGELGDRVGPVELLGAHG